MKPGQISQCILVCVCVGGGGGGKKAKITLNYKRSDPLTRLQAVSYKVFYFEGVSSLFGR